MKIGIRTRDGAEVEVSTDYSRPDEVDVDLLRSNGALMAGIVLTSDLASVLGKALIAAAEEEME